MIRERCIANLCQLNYVLIEISKSNNIEMPNILDQDLPYLLVDELQREVDGVSNELREHHLYG
jgi:hypothetical protein